MEELMAKYLANELGQKERADFESKLIHDESFKFEFESCLNVWALQDEAQSHRFDARAAWGIVQKQIRATSVVEMKKSSFSFLKIAAILLVLTVAGFFVVKNTTLVEPAPLALLTYTTPMNATRTFQLPDGTTVKLNANSKISCDKAFGESHRHVTLTGQADFDVMRDEKMPFIIKAGKSEIKVLGTNFDVAAYRGKSLKVSVTEGTVAFASTVDQGQKAVLTRGQQAEMDEGGRKLEVSEIKNQNYKGWWTKELIFENTPFSEAFEILERTYHVEIQYAQALKDCPWTAQFDPLDDIDGIMEVFGLSFNAVSITQKENQIILDGTACDK